MRYYGTHRITRKEKRALNILYGPMQPDIDTLRALYESERKQANRTFASGHSFEEWLQYRNERVTPLPGLATK